LIPCPKFGEKQSPTELHQSLLDLGCIASPRVEQTSHSGSYSWSPPSCNIIRIYMKFKSKFIYYTRTQTRHI
jgi:hypothetical protein